MTTKKTKAEFLPMFPDHVYRYIDSNKERPPISCSDMRSDLNLQGYESYFTVNGFKDAPNAQKDNCTSINAFFLDIDGRKDEEELSKIQKILDPTFIVETGKGYHIYWLLDEPIYREDVTADEWAKIIERWEKIEQNIVTTLKGDPQVKDLTRILRVPNTYYWKGTGDKWKEGTDGVFKIKGKYKELSNTYTMDVMEETFPTPENALIPKDTSTHSIERANKFAEAERKNFHDKVNALFPVEERDSFKRLINGKDSSTLPRENIRNTALLVTASLARQAGWSLEKALNHFLNNGWHGIENEKGGYREIETTVKSAYQNAYTFSSKHEVIAHNVSPEESMRLQQAFTGVLKERKEQDKVRFSNYERELLSRYPHLRKNEIGMVFRYDNGVYRMMTDQEVSDMVLNGLYEDMLWGYRTKKNVADKVACLLSIIPILELSNDHGCIANVKNGLLNIFTRELMPHTPAYVSLIQFPVVYDPEAKCPVWDNCIKDWMEGPEQEKKTRLLKQFSGYILSSSMTYDRALFMVGDGGNGKSTFIDTIARVIGPDATSHIDLESLYGPFGMHGLIGKRLNIIEEVHGNYYQSNKLKKLISGEQVTIDIKYKPQFTFRPQAKFVFSVNLLPRVDDTSTATERRICCLQFLKNYRKNPNTQLRSSFGLLAKELSGILNWMIDGAQDLAQMGNFIVTEEQKRMLDEYREENSSVEGFLAQCVVQSEFNEIEVPTLYSEYKKWCSSDGGRKAKSNYTFTKEVVAYGEKDNRFTYKKRTYAGDEAKFIGIKLAPQWVKQNNNW